MCGLFEKTWFSDKPSTCPKIREWLTVVDKQDRPKYWSGPAPVEENCTVEGGIPSRMSLNIHSLDFGNIRRSANSIQLRIENIGGSVLQGTILAEPWLKLSAHRFKILPGKSMDFTVSLSETLPKPQSKDEFRSASALMIESNGGSAVLGGSFRFPKKGLFG